MSAGELFSLARRHIFAVTFIVLATAGIGFFFKNTKPVYAENATVSVEPGNAYSWETGAHSWQSEAGKWQLYRTSLITACQLIVIQVTGQEEEAQLSGFGVGNNFAITLINSSNADNPTHNFPYLQVSVSDSTSSMTIHDFGQAMQVLASNLTELQSRDGISPADAIKARILANSGPVAQRGSKVRSYIALVFLGLVATFLLANLLDRRPDGWIIRRRGAAR